MTEYKDIIPLEQRRKILFMGDDCFVPSGVGTVAREIIMGLAHKYKIVQIAGALHHPDKGKIKNMNEVIRKESGVQDAELTQYPVEGYGNPDILRQIIKREQPDAIFHITDPRYWMWLYAMKNEIDIPIIYYTIWDDLPYPYYNRAFYESCESLICISKQTKNIVKNVLGEENIIDVDYIDDLTMQAHLEDLHHISYVPHGLNTKKYFPILDANEDLVKVKKQIFGNKEPEFVLFFNSRNIRRKAVSDIIWSYKMFVDTLPEDKKKSTYLILHTDIVDDAGTDLIAVVEAIVKKDYNIVFHTNKVDSSELNLLYNLADITVNVSSAEGWGLSATESLLTGTMILVNVTGGLQDQCGFVDETGNIMDFEPNFPTNSVHKYDSHGEWALTVYPHLSIVGSPVTPYIYDSRADIESIAKQMQECYNMGKDERKRRGMLGYEYAIKSGYTAKVMAERMYKNIELVLNNYISKPKYNLYDTDKKLYEQKYTGCYNYLTQKFD